MRETIEIELTKGHRARVYSDTWERLKLDRLKWRAMVVRGKYVYAVAYCGSLIYMHRLICEAQKGQQADHINHDTLDNRDDNLRACTASQNACNRKPRSGTNAGLKGVWWCASSRKWGASITRDGMRYHLGVFAHKERAGLAVDRAALALHGEFAGLNYPGRNTRAKLPTGGYRAG